MSIDKFLDLGINNDEFINKEYVRLSWDDYFMRLAYLVSKRSPDAQTNHGSVIVDKNNRIISTGYNGYPAGGPDNIMPNLRNKKYTFIIHSEMNAILSAKQNITGYTLYITGMPCNNCLLHIIASGIRNIVVGDVAHKFFENWQNIHNCLVELYDVNIRKFSLKDE